jgi:hypothetical protein
VEVFFKTRDLGQGEFGLMFWESPPTPIIKHDAKVIINLNIDRP